MGDQKSEVSNKSNNKENEQIPIEKTEEQPPKQQY